MRVTPILYILASLVNVSVATSCPESDGSTLETNLGSFHVQCGADRPGGDMPNSPVWTPSFDDCIYQCDHDDMCRGALWSPGSPGACYLKSDLKTAVYNPNIWAAINPLSECPTYNGTNQDIALNTIYTVECYQDRIGGDMPNSPVWTPTFHACMEACEGNSGCVDISWIPPTGSGNGVCYMKNELKTGFVNSAVWGARRWSVCPDMDGQPWEDGCGAWYQVECFMDRFGGVMAPSPVTTHSFEMCVYLCGQNPNCVDISWEQGYPAGTCWLKSSVGEASQNMGVYGARQLSPCTEMLPVYTNL